MADDGFVADYGRSVAEAHNTIISARADVFEAREKLRACLDSDDPLVRAETPFLKARLVGLAGVLATLEVTYEAMRDHREQIEKEMESE